MAYYIGDKILPQYNEKYVFVSNDYSEDFLHIIGAGIVYPDKKYSFTRVLDCTLFEYVISGIGHISVDGERYTVGAGNCIIARENTPISYYSDRDAPYTKLWFTVKGSFVDKLFEAFEGTRAVTIASVDLQSHFERILQGLEKETLTVLDTAHELLDITYAINSNISDSISEHPFDFASVKSYVDANLSKSISLENVAVRFDVSVKKIIELFKREIGTTPHRYIKTERLKAAKRMLEGTENSISEIAQSLGFCEQSYFSAEFKKEFGIYPTAHRKAFRASKEIHFHSKEFDVSPKNRSQNK